MQTKIIAFVSLLASVALSIGAHYVTDYWRDFLMMLAGTALSLCVGILAVNLYLNTDERRRAAGPLLQMIVPDVKRYHNDFLIDRGRLAFGTPAFNSLLTAYSAHKGSPKAFSPEQRDCLYKMILEQKDAILALLPGLEGKLREMASLIGWTYEPSIIRAILTCRLSIQAFQSLQFDDSLQNKLDACEHFLDIDASSSAVLEALMKILGKKDEDWQNTNG